MVWTRNVIGVAFSDCLPHCRDSPIVGRRVLIEKTCQRKAGYCFVMLSALIKILKKGIEEKSAILKENGLALRLTEFIIKNEEIPEESRILSMMLKGQVPLSLPEYYPISDRDIRIMRLYINNVRQYCITDKNADYYSLSLEKSGRPSSSVFLGANGSGKTTLYASLEYLYLGQSAVAQAHGDDFNDLYYLRGINHTITDIDIKANLVNLDILDNRVEGWEIPAAFCSECDYFELTRYWNEKEDFFAEQLGYEEMICFLSRLKTLKQWFVLAKKYGNNNKEINIIKIKLKESGISSDETKKLEKKKDSLLKENKRLNTEFFQVGGELCSTHLIWFVKRIENNPLIDHMEQDLDILIDYLRREWHIILKELEKTCALIIDMVVGQSLESKYETIRLKANNDNIQFSLNVRSKLNEGDSEEMTPVQYFNTFRLKLFCVSLKMGLFCCAKKIHGVNMPFVVDDVFDSSDFANRARIRRFMREIFKAHDKALSGSLDSDVKNTKYPLQMIFFTQDNIIGENVYRGISDVIYDGECCEEIDVKYGRLFSPHNANPKEEGNIDYREGNIGGKAVKSINIEDSQILNV